MFKTNIFLKKFSKSCNFFQKHDFARKSFYSVAFERQKFYYPIPTQNLKLLRNKFISNQSRNVLTDIRSSIPTSMFLCSVNNPIEHDNTHLNKFYKINPDDLNKIDPFKECLDKEYYAEGKSFGQTSLMIRKPAIEVINYIKNIDLNMPAYRFVLYGSQNGTGKRSTLFHLLHYCYKDNWLIINLPNCSSVLRMAKEIMPSFYKEGRVDTPIEASLFLKRFLIQNTNLLKNLNMKTTKSYNWSSRDSSPAGTPLIELINYANERIKYSSDICGAIIREIKLQSREKNFKVFVAIDQMNSYFGPTRLRRQDNSEVLVDDVTIVRNFKKLVKNDWNNAVIVGSVGKLGVIIPAPNRRKKFYDTSISIAQRRRVPCVLHYEGPLSPTHLLKKEGFYFLEPFVPIEVPSYSNEEILNHYEYYKENNWIQNPMAKTDDGRDEIIFLSGKNPAEFMRVCQMI